MSARRFAAAFATATAVAAALATAQAPTVTTVLSNGTTQTRYDMVILGDGYQSSQQATFNQDVLNFLTALFQKQPYQTFAGYFNVHTVFRASVDSGADRPDETPPVFVNTVYNCTYNYGGVDRCLYVQNTSQALADAALAPANEGRVLVMVNDTRYGGCAATFAVSYNGGWMTEVQTHELGHSLGQLADEYDYPNQTYTGSEPTAVNITTSPTGQKWSIWHGTDGISSFQGAGYYLFGLYRPRSTCLMRDLGAVLCRVCQENITRLTSAVVDVIVSTSPAAATVNVAVPTVQTFSITHIVPPGNNPQVTWKLDGVVIPGATGTSWQLDPSAVAVGTHTVEVTVLDQTPLVRTDPSNTMRDAHGWQVNVSNPTLAQLRIPSATPAPLWVQRGTPVTIDVDVVNDGPASAGPFDVEFFLSSAPTWTAQSTYLGKITVPVLAALQTVQLQHPTQMPWSLLPQPYYAFAVADRVDVVDETNENDNARLFTLLGQASPCVTKLEFQDPLVYPFDAASLSVASGGAVHPTVVAPCANPATTLYLIAWTGSGTSPGLSLGPGLVLPLNFDPFTQLGLDALNTPVFGSFLGILDAQGLGHATFALPPATSLPLGTTHFACVLLGNTQLFTAVTNAVALTLH